ncbi:uncharacterized protein LOC106763484 [Vigna radiata var. radiata]|uniref:Uncharacterized protein LOC106763484 n=1 Tax=Vigna radiata var. radiata TaxID=3916 RepID=A0A1S3UAU9_VIGRR|nr:uncharacterized protein LOC106763484 [Vigna radiata var. radiata]
MADYTTIFSPHHFNSIARLMVNPANMEVKPVLIQVVKSNLFNGLSRESPYEHLTTFSEICNTVNINSVPDEAIKLTRSGKQMPSYAKFLKENVTKKRKYIEKETIEVQGNCSAIIQKMLPPKLQDPGSFTIPCTIGDLEVGRALIDLGANINLMQLFMFKRIQGLELKPTRMTLQLADKSLKNPYGVVEDVMVKVDKFFFPMDFVIMEMEENGNVSLILERPFMKTTRVLIDVENDKLKVRVQDEEVNFDLFKAMSHPKDDKACFQVDIIDEVCMMQGKKVRDASPLERTLIDECEDLNEEEEKLIDECLTDLEVLKEIPMDEASFEKLIPRRKSKK